jgi:multidrug efflux pump subunit AcrA (membrane-fusion protein)
MSVTVAPVENTRIARKLSVTGTVAARELIAVLPQITGLQIEQILVDEGDLVKAGQVIAVLDDSVLQTQINGAKAEIESTQAVVSKDKQPWLRTRLPWQKPNARSNAINNWRMLVQLVAKNWILGLQKLPQQEKMSGLPLLTLTAAKLMFAVARRDCNNSKLS